MGNEAAVLKVAQSGLRSGMPDIERLYELGKKRQWNASELAWDSLDFTAVPFELRQGLSELLTQIHYGELGALTASAQLVHGAPSLMDKMFGSTQVIDEARHVEWFSRLLFQLDAPMPVVPAVAALIDDIVHTAQSPALLVGMNILIEGLAQTLMLEAGRVLRMVSVDGMQSLALVGSWLVERIAHDESRHLVFGITRVRQLVECMDVKQRSRLDQQVGGWARKLLALTAERSAGVAAFGLDGDALMARCLSDTRTRLAHAGLSLEA